jgi:hypothetical protein
MLREGEAYDPSFFIVDARGARLADAALPHLHPFSPLFLKRVLAPESGGLPEGAGGKIYVKTLMGKTIPIDGRIKASKAS